MLDSLIRAIQQSVTPEVVVLDDGKQYVSGKLHHPPDLPQPDEIETNTLVSVVDYLSTTALKEIEEPFIHVVSPSQVRVCGRLTDLNSRFRYLTASYRSNRFAFEHPYEQFAFITLVRSDFVDDGDREQLLKIVASLMDESSVRLEDDGLSQKTHVNAGIATKAKLEVPQVFKLTPYRTFSEITQPEGTFILRLHKSREAPPTISLHQADNDHWRVEAIKSIADYLAAATDDIPIIA